MRVAVPSRRKSSRRAALTITALLLVLAMLSYLNSGAFEEKMRLAMVARLARITGGQVELGRLHYSLWRGEIDGSDLTIHGAEPPSGPPFLHVDHFLLRFSLFSAPGKVTLRSALVDHPVLHLITAPAGTSNRPAAEEAASPQVQEMLKVGAGQFEARNGEVIWSDYRVPLNVNVEDTEIMLRRSGVLPHFSGLLQVGKIESAINGFRPFAASASAEFQLTAHDWRFSSVNVRSGGSQLRADLHISDPAAMIGDAQYVFDFDLHEIGDITRTRELRAGNLHLNGIASFSPIQFNATGQAALTRLAWESSTTHIPRLDAKAPFLVRDHELTLSRISADCMRATFSGRAVMKGWDSFWHPVTARQRSVAGNIKATGVRLEDIATVFPSSRFSALNLAGTAAGEATIAWTGSLPNIKAAVTAKIVPPAVPRIGTVPLSGEIGAEISAQETRLPRLRLKTASSSITATGLVGRKESDLSLAIDSSQVREIVRAFSVLEGWKPPVEVDGGGSFSGRMTGSLEDPVLAGRVELTGMQVALRPSRLWQTEPLESFLDLAGYDPSRSQPVAWDRLAGDLDFSPAAFSFRNAVIQGKLARADLSLQAGLQSYELAPDSRLAAKVTAAGIPLKAAQGFLGSRLAADGSADMDVKLSGTIQDPHGDGRLTIRGGSLEGKGFRVLTTNLTLAEHEARFSDIELDLTQATLKGTGAYNWVSQAFRLNLDSNQVDLAKLQSLQRPRFSVQGLASLHLDGQGTRAQPRINSNLLVRRLVLNGEAEGDLSVQAVTRGHVLYLSLQSNFVRAKLVGSGNVAMNGDWPAQFNFNFSRLDIDPLLTALIAGRVTQHSALDGTIQVSGPLLRPRQLEFEALLHHARIEIENLPVETSGPADIRLRNGLLSVQRFHVVGQGTDLVADGEIPITGSASGRGLDATGRFNLQILQSFEPDLSSSGTATASVNVGGSLAQPAITGRLQIEDAGLSFSDLTAGLTNINGSMVFNENRLSIESLSARTGGGQFNVGGFLSYSHGFYFDFAAKGSQMRLRYPPGVSSVADADLRFSGSLTSSLLSGTITVTRFGLSPQFDFAQYLSPRSQTAMMTPPDSALNRIHFDVRVVTSPELRVQMSLARVAGNADLRLRGTAAKPVVLGRVNIVEGQISFSGTKYRIDRGDIVFSNPVTITPVLDIEASARVRDYDVTLGVHGPLQKLSTTYRSDPPLPAPEIVALIALGHTHQDEVLSNQPQTTASLESTNALLQEALNTSQNSWAQQLFGASRLKIDPEAGGLENNPNTRLTLEQQVSDRVTLTYLTNLSQQAQQSVQVEVQLSRSLSIVGLRDPNGIFSLTFRLRQRKR